MNMLCIIILVFAGLSIYADALTVGAFESLSPGIWDEWNKTNPENVKQGDFVMKYGYGNLWLVSKRLYRKGTEHPWDPASRGGIVSTLRVSTKVWTHKSYDRLEEDKYGDQIFSLNGRLFMLTYTNDQRKILFHKLFYWQDENSKWVEIPLEIHPNATTESTNAITALSMCVPKQEGKVAYLAASVLKFAAGGGSERAFSKLETEFKGNKPIKAAIKAVFREKGDRPQGVLALASASNTLYAFTADMMSEGYVPQYESAFTIDLGSNKPGRVNLTGDNPPIDYNDGRIFQTKNDKVIMTGGLQSYGLGQLREVYDIWLLDLKTFQWSNTTQSMPTGKGSNVAFDQQGGNLYIAGLKEGVTVAKISP